MKIRDDIIFVFEFSVAMVGLVLWIVSNKLKGVKDGIV